jgi:hypothetical protein
MSTVHEDTRTPVPFALPTPTDIADHLGDVGDLGNVGALGEAAAIAEVGSAPQAPSLAELVAESGLRRVHMLAWRDLDDPEAGGSELHADKVASAWAEVGVDVSLRTALAPGHPETTRRNGYTVVRKAGRYSVFPRTACSGALGHGGRGTAWSRSGTACRSSPRSGRAARGWCSCTTCTPKCGGWCSPPGWPGSARRSNSRLPRRFYRNTRILTLSESSRQEIIELLGLRRRNISVVPPGIDARYSPGGERSHHPLVLAVGRLVPVKRFHLLIDALAKVRTELPTMEAVIVGEGYIRDELEAQIHAVGAGGWLKLAGRVDDAGLLELYRRAWVLTSASAREGWGMTITEAAACGTPAVATRIAGHTDAVADGRSGLLVADPAELAGALRNVLADTALRERLSAGALAHAETFTWAATARSTFAALADEAARDRSDRTRLRPPGAGTSAGRAGILGVGAAGLIGGAAAIRAMRGMRQSGDRRGPTGAHPRRRPRPGRGHAGRGAGSARRALIPARWIRWVPSWPVWALAALTYLPLLATSPGRIGADTKAYLYLDPGRMLSQAVSMWDPHVGAGTVTHQNIGYLFPQGCSTGCSTPPGCPSG